MNTVVILFSVIPSSYLEKNQFFSSVPQRFFSKKGMKQTDKEFLKGSSKNLRNTGEKSEYLG